MRNYELADKPGCTKHWRSIDENGERHIYHYSTLMLAFDLDENNQWNGNMKYVYTSTGHGSVSDQNTMNELFARLGMPLLVELVVLESTC